MAQGTNYSLKDQYKKKFGIPYLNIKVQGASTIIVGLLISLTIIIVFTFLLKIPFIIGLIVGVVLGAVYIALMSEIDKKTGMPIILSKYYSNKNYSNQVIVDGIVFFIWSSKKRNIDNCYIVDKKG